MDGKRLAQGLFNATGDDLRLVYALVMETKMLDLLIAKSKDVFNKDLNHFEVKLQEEMKQLRNYSDEELQLKLFLYVLEQLDIQGAHFNLPVEIDYACEQAVKKTHALQMKQDKAYREFAELKEKDYDASSILVLYQMQKIFESFDEGRAELSDAETEQLADQIENYIQSLPADKQQQIKEKLHIDELTNKTIKQLIATQGTAILMAIIVEVAGFAAFTTLTSAIAATVGLFGVTLPFGAYIFATSAFSILTGPVGLALMAVGGGYLINIQNKKVRKALLPIGVVQLLLPAMLEEAPVDYARFISLWNKLFERQVDYKKQLEKLELDLKGLREDKHGYEQELVDVNAFIVKTNGACFAELEKIEAQVDSIVLADMSQEFKHLTAKMGELRETIEQLEAERNRNAATTGFWNKVKGAVANTSLSSQAKKLEKEWLAVKAERTQEVVKMQPRNLTSSCEKVMTYKEQLTRCRQDQGWLEARIQEKTNEIRKAEQSLKAVRGELKQIQKQWYGFAHIG